MIDVLADEPMLLLGLVLAVGSIIGVVEFRGISIGPAGALFAGLAASALDERLVIPNIVGVVGLALFTYCIGLSTGPEFVKSLRSSLATMAMMVVVLATLAPLAAVLGAAAGLAEAQVAGLYAGALTNTPALAGVQSLLEGPDLGLPVVGYALAYPFGVLGMIAAAAFAGRSDETDDAVTGGLDNVSVCVGQGRPTTVGAMRTALGDRIVLGRLQREDHEWIPDDRDELRANDIVSITGAPDRIDEAAALIGGRMPSRLADDRRRLDFRRIVVSNEAVAGARLADLEFPQRHGAIITRIRRGRQDVLAHRDSRLEPGDRVRVVAPPEAMDAIAAELGDDERRAAEFYPRGFSVGLVLGLLIGIVPIPVPGAGTITLGAAGGPLLVGLVLGWRERTGPLVWQVPHGVSITLRQLGSLLFLGMAGTSGGAALRAALSDGDAIAMLAIGAVITSTSALAMMAIARARSLRPAATAGLLGGAQTQPAVLAFAAGRSDDPALDINYALALPAAMVVKIIAAQLMVLL